MFYRCSAKNLCGWPNLESKAPRSGCIKKYCDWTDIYRDSTKNMSLRLHNEIGRIMRESLPLQRQNYDTIGRVMLVIREDIVLPLQRRNDRDN